MRFIFPLLMHAYVACCGRVWLRAWRGAPVQDDSAGFMLQHMRVAGAAARHPVSLWGRTMRVHHKGSSRRSRQLCNVPRFRMPCRATGLPRLVHTGKSLWSVTVSCWLEMAAAMASVSHAGCDRWWWFHSPSEGFSVWRRPGRRLCEMSCDDGVSQQ